MHLQVVRVGIPERAACCVQVQHRLRRPLRREVVAHGLREVLVHLHHRDDGIPLTMAVRARDDALFAGEGLELFLSCLPRGELGHDEKIAIVVRVDPDLDRLVAPRLTCGETMSSSA
eukprot:4937451-Pleurochrysis_carterae.AAC.2